MYDAWKIGDLIEIIYENDPNGYKAECGRLGIIVSHCTDVFYSNRPELFTVFDVNCGLYFKAINKCYFKKVQ